MVKTSFISLLVVILCCTKESLGSVGDRSNEFQDCLLNCESLCIGTVYPAVLPWQLVIFGWSCQDECKYECMHNITQVRVKLGYEVLQYYGKVCITSLLTLRRDKIPFSVYQCGLLFSKFTLFENYIFLTIL